MLNGIMFNIVMLNAIMLNAIMLNAIILNAIMLNDMFNVVLLNVIFLNIIMLNVVAPPPRLIVNFLEQPNRGRRRRRRGTEFGQRKGEASIAKIKMLRSQIQLNFRLGTVATFSRN